MFVAVRGSVAVVNVGVRLVSPTTYQGTDHVYVLG